MGAWIGFLVFFFAIGWLITLVPTGVLFGATQSNVMNMIMGWQQTRNITDWAPVDLLTAPIDFFNGVYTMLSFNFPVFGPNSDYEILRTIFLTPIGAAIIITLILVFFGIFSKTTS